MPDAVSWWPPAPGWWLLFFLSAYVAYRLSKLVLKWHRSPRRAALRELCALRAGTMPEPHNPLMLRRLSVLLRRCALSQYPSMQVAGLVGEQWLAFLDETGKTNDFLKGPGRVLVDQSYAKRADYDVNSVLTVVDSWIRRAMPSVRYDS